MEYSAIPPGVGAVDLTPVIRAVEVPAVGRMETVPPIVSPDSGRMSPDSPPTVAFEDLSVSSVPMSHNCVQVDNSQDVPEEGPVFEVSPVTLGFLMRPSGAAVQTPGACFPLPQVLNAFSDPVLGDPVAFALTTPVPGSDASPMTLPIHTMTPGLTFLPGQSSVQMVMASAVSSGLEWWSSGMSQTLDVSREGPFDAYSSPMDTGDSPLITTGLPGCPYRITSYTGPAVADTNPAFGMQLHHTQFLEFIGAFERGGYSGSGSRSTAGRR